MVVAPSFSINELYARGYLCDEQMLLWKDIMMIYKNARHYGDFFKDYASMFFGKTSVHRYNQDPDEEEKNAYHYKLWRHLLACLHHHASLNALHKQLMKGVICSSFARRDLLKRYFDFIKDFLEANAHS
jgi:hypothetical protein